jgi:hypothetical protein
VEAAKNKIKPTYWGAERTGNTSSINNYPGVSMEQHFSNKVTPFYFIAMRMIIHFAKVPKEIKK